MLIENLSCNTIKPCMFTNLDLQLEHSPGISSTLSESHGRFAILIRSLRVPLWSLFQTSIERRDNGDALTKILSIKRDMRLYERGGGIQWLRRPEPSKAKISESAILRRYQSGIRPTLSTAANLFTLTFWARSSYQQPTI